MGMWLSCFRGVYAGTSEQWAAIYDGRLTEALDHDGVSSIAIYEAVAAQLPTDDPLYGELMFWLGRARMLGGDSEGARDALGKSADDPNFHDAARSFLGQVLRSEAKGAEFPLRQGFDDGLGGWLRGWPRGDDADLTVLQTDGPPGSVLAWSLVVEEGQTDFVLLPVARQPFQKVRVFLRAEGFSAHVRLTVEDEAGIRWSTDDIRVPADSWEAVEVTRSSFRLENPKDELADSPNRIVALLVEDVTSQYSDLRGNNQIWMDEVEVFSHESALNGVRAGR